ncbi:MAG TPA: type IV secretion protein IcmD [Coxiellaceae bacterium]|nr:type IV secretion protein IcmD [Coxiellaceae bacterium]
MKVTIFKKSNQLVLTLIGISLISESAFALTLQSIYQNVGSAMGITAKIISAVALISGISFIVSAFFKFHQHKQNPTQVTVGQGIVLLLIGAALCVFPTLIPTFESVLTGTTGSTASIWGTDINNLIGG